MTITLQLMKYPRHKLELLLKWFKMLTLVTRVKSVALQWKVNTACRRPAFGSHHSHRQFTTAYSCLQGIWGPLLFSIGTCPPPPHTHEHICNISSMSLSYSLLAFSLTLSADRTHSLVSVNWLQSRKVQFAAPKRRLPVYYFPVSPALSPSIKVFGALKALK